jgi:organic radical activating enzyme
MADPNQTPQRGEWACPCAGCTKAVAWERKQLINIIRQMGEKAYTSIPYEDIIQMIEDRKNDK